MSVNIVDDSAQEEPLSLGCICSSERVHKSKASGVLVREAGHINKSLHFLEMVIVALDEAATAGRKHIPYRNSLMTSVLRDSLGGNCITAMIATLNPEPVYTDESLSTCRFAQRVARVVNSAVVNEEVDTAAFIRTLRARVTELEVTTLTSDQSSRLSEADEAEIIMAAHLWVASAGDETLAIGANTLSRAQCAFRALKNIARQTLTSRATTERNEQNGIEQNVGITGDTEHVLGTEAIEEATHASDAANIAESPAECSTTGLIHVTDDESDAARRLANDEMPAMRVASDDAEPTALQAATQYLPRTSALLPNGVAVDIAIIAASRQEAERFFTSAHPDSHVREAAWETMSARDTYSTGAWMETPAQRSARTYQPHSHIYTLLSARSSMATGGNSKNALPPRQVQLTSSALVVQR